MPALSKPTAVKKPMLTNRGPAGLNDKLTPEAKKRLVPAVAGTHDQQTIPVAPINRIAEDLRSLIVPITSLILDPNNARLHPERNLEAIKGSLALYGQMKPLVVRKQSRTVVAGNGTLEAALALGWTEIAVTMSEMSEVEAAGYGLADNRTAELAKWDFEVVARLEKLMFENNHTAVGWTVDELEVLRAADWTPPSVAEGGEGFTGDSSSDPNSLTISILPEEREALAVAIDKCKERPSNKDASDGCCIKQIAEEWCVMVEEK